MEYLPLGLQVICMSAYLVLQVRCMCAYRSRGYLIRTHTSSCMSGENSICNFCVCLFFFWQWLFCPSIASTRRAFKTAISDACSTSIASHCFGRTCPFRVQLVFIAVQSLVDIRPRTRRGGQKWDRSASGPQF